MDRWLVDANAPLRLVVVVVVVVDVGTLSRENAMNVTLFFATELGEGDGGTARVWPDAHGAVGGGGGERATPGREGEGDGWCGETSARVRAIAGFVIEYFDGAIWPGDGEEGAVGVGDGRGGELGVGGVVDDAEDGGVGGVPPGDLAVGSGRHDL